MGKGGEIFVLNMGDPVKIVDLARNLILLSGLRPDEDIPIEFTGVRPGEKLYEELNLFDEDTLPTAHEKIRIFAGNGLPAGNMAAYMENLRRLCASGDARNLILALKEILPDYNPSAFVLRRLLADDERPTAITAA
ncbi:MAG: polysaccharide biosynthesis protein [Acidobacteria bacterium]|nr:polysaccharide biosynthesis protein [Acidobacteriota bacterium]